MSGEKSNENKTGSNVSYSEEIAEDHEEDNTEVGVVGGLYDTIKKEISSVSNKIADSKVSNCNIYIHLFELIFNNSFIFVFSRECWILFFIKISSLLTYILFDIIK